MKPHDHDAGDDLSGLESELRSLRPRSASEGFAERVALEARLRSLSPRAPSEGFAERVVAAGAVSGRSRLFRFPGALAPLAAAAALAVAFAPALQRNRHAAPATVAEPVAVASAATYAGLPEEALHLPVINLPDGSAYRPVLRPRLRASGAFRAMPVGVVMPVGHPVSAGVDYEPVVFE